MTVKEYLGQAYLLDQRIQSDTMECEELRLMSQTISSSGFEEHFNASRNTAAPYIRTLEKMLDMEKRIMEELQSLLALKDQIREVISQVERPEYKTVLKYRYIHNYSWTRIADIVAVDERTIRRWHNKAIAKIILPENAINLKNVRVCP
jgi:DNA-directed RNA polymerase specialized sigma subunit